MGLGNTKRTPVRLFISISQRVFLFATLGFFAVGAGATEPDAGAAKRDGVWKAGTAKAIITPDSPLWMAGFGARTNVSRGKLQELYAKALALEDQDGRRSVLVTTDLVGFPAPIAKTIADRVNQQHGLARERLILNSSHTHSGPQVSDRLIFWNDWRMSPAQVRDIEDYTRGLEDKVVGVIGTALSNLQPARLNFGRTAMRFAVNRRLKTETGYYASFVPNPAGPVDHDVPLLRIDSDGGLLRGVVFGYACHTSTLLSDNHHFSGDYAGFAQAWLEQHHPDATAFFVQGCGGDIMVSPRGTVELAQKYGELLAAAVEQAVHGATRPIRGSLHCGFEVVPVAFAPPPSRAELEARAQGKGTESARQAREFLRASADELQSHAQELLKVLDRDGRLPTEYPYPLQVWQFGQDLTFVALAGEPVADYALRLKKELGADKLWVAGYCNDMFAYIPSRRVLEEGGYEGGGAIVGARLPGSFAPTVEETIIRKVHELVERTRVQ